MADVQAGADVADLFHHFVGRTDQDIAAVDDVLHVGGLQRRLGRGIGDVGGLLHHALNAGALRCFRDVARRRRELRVDVQAATVEIFRRLAVEVERLLAAFGDAHELQEAGAVGIAVLAELLHLVPEALHGREPGLVAVVGEIAVDVVHLRAPPPCLDRAAARNPDRRVRVVLDRPRPDVDVALLVVAAVEGEGVLFGPRLLHQVMGFEVALAQEARVLAVGVAGVHRRADREARDQPAAGDAVDHRELFGHARRRIVERQRVAHDADRGVGGAAREGTGDQVGRRHQPIAVRMVLVHAHRVVAELGGILELVHEVVVHVMGASGVEQRRMDVDPDAGVLPVKVLGQLRVRHQVEPHELHGACSLNPDFFWVNDRLPAQPASTQKPMQCGISAGRG